MQQPSDTPNVDDANDGRRQELLTRLKHLTPPETPHDQGATNIVWDASWDATWDASWNAYAP
jgi:hypothetical protein